MGLILDLAVAALALLVIGSLGLLAWTLGVSSVRATRQGRRRVAVVRQGVRAAEDRLPSRAADLDATLARLAARTTPSTRLTRSTLSTPSKPGDEPDE